MNGAIARRRIRTRPPHIEQLGSDTRLMYVQAEHAHSLEFVGGGVAAGDYQHRNEISRRDRGVRTFMGVVCAAVVVAPSSVFGMMSGVAQASHHTNPRCSPHLSRIVECPHCLKLETSRRKQTKP